MAMAEVSDEFAKECLSDRRIGVIGGGNMAKSILFPLFDKGIIDPKTVKVAGNTLDNLLVWEQRGCEVFSNEPGDVFKNSNVIIWAVKPQVFPELLKTHYEALHLILPCTLHISVMAGITLKHINDALNFWCEKNFKNRGQLPYFNIQFCIIRAMPSMAARVGVGFTVFSPGANPTREHVDWLKCIFGPTGYCCELPENQINTVCALSGSGLGFMFPIMEAMADGGVRMGLPRSLALKIAAQSMKGAAELFLKEGTHPAVLKDSVCSPGGTTISGIAEIEKAGVRSGMIRAIEAATNRSEELANNFKLK